MVFMKDGHEYQEVKKEINVKDSLTKTSLGRFILRPEALRKMADNLEARTGIMGDKDILVSLYRVDIVDKGKKTRTIGVLPVEEKVKVIKTKKQAKKVIKKVVKEKAVEKETPEEVEAARLKDLRKRKKRRHIAKIYSDLQKKQAKKKAKQNG